MVDEERAVLDAGVGDEVEGWDLVAGHDEGGQRGECARWFWGHVARCVCVMGISVRWDGMG